MGIGQKRGESWFHVVSKTRADEVERIKKGFMPRLKAPIVGPNPECIKTTEAANALILSRTSPRDEEGNLVPSTERGKRRRAKRSGG